MFLCMISLMDDIQNPKPALGTDFFARVDSGNPSNQPAGPNPEVSQEPSKTIFPQKPEEAVAPEANKRKFSLKKIFNYYPSRTIPPPLRKPLYKIFKEETEILKKSVNKFFI